MSANLPASVQAPIALTSSTNSITAAVPKVRTIVTSLVVYAATATTMNLQSHTTTGNKTGTIGIPVAGLVLPYNPDGWFATTPGEGLDIVAAGNASGSITYVQE